MHHLTIDTDLCNSVSTSPKLSMVTKKNGSRMSTHEPVTVRGNRTNRLQVNEDNVQYCIAPAHINVRSNSLPIKESCLPVEI